MRINLAIYYRGDGHYDMFPEQIEEKLLVISNRPDYAMWIQWTHRKELNITGTHGVTMYYWPDLFFYRFSDFVYCLFHRKIVFI